MASDLQEMMLVRKRIFGALLHDARSSLGFEPADVARVLGIDEKEYLDFEKGDRAPTLPQLEVIAYYLDIPIGHFWGAETLASARQSRDISEQVPEMLMLRQKIIGARLKQLRVDRNMTQAQVAEASGLSMGQIEVVERGLLPLPITALERITRALETDISKLVDSGGTVGNWLQAHEQFEDFSKLSPEFRDFIVKPINRSYLELAIKLSQMNVSRLREIAESILDITY